MYIPGLGDRYDWFRSVALRLWRLGGVHVEFVAIKWYNGENFDDKMSRVNAAITRHKNERIVVFGESAGAALALQAAKIMHVDRVVTICGVAQPQTPISNYLNTRAPALVPAARTITNVNKVDVHSVRAFYDPVVGKKYSIAPGAKRHIVWTLGHFTTIAICLTFLAPLMLTIAKKSNV